MQYLLLLRWVRTSQCAIAKFKLRSGNVSRFKSHGDLDQLANHGTSAAKTAWHTARFSRSLKRFTRTQNICAAAQNFTRKSLLLCGYAKNVTKFMRTGQKCNKSHPEPWKDLRGTEKVCAHLNKFSRSTSFSTRYWIFIQKLTKKLQNVCAVM